MSEPKADTRAQIALVREEVSKAIVGQHGIVSGLITAMLVGGHVLLEGVPGTAKTLMVSSLAAALDLDNNRITFTPDMMPSDVIGQTVYNPSAPNMASAFVFRSGPVFTNLLLADEINRTPPRTQSALLEAMEERHVTVDGRPRSLPDPFLVIATQNPVEQEGTYPLPEAQLDRFVFKLHVGYPNFEDELEVLRRHDSGMTPHDIESMKIHPVANGEIIRTAKAEITALETDDVVLRYIIDIVSASRRTPSLSLGVSPRGSTWLLKAAKAWAWLQNRNYVTPDDVKAMVIPTLGHRITIRPDVVMDGATPTDILQTILSGVPVPK